jgi:hypothetical protein
MHLTLPEDLKDLYQQIAALESDGLAIAKAGLNTGSYGYVPENHLGITTRGRGFEVPPEKQAIGFGYPQKTAAFKYESSAASADTLPRIEKPFGFLPRDSKPVNAPSAMLQTTDKHSSNATESAFSVDTQHGTVSTRNDKAISFASFSELPVHPEGHCLWCGCKLDGKTKRAKFCGTAHKNFYWNLKTPANKRVTR